MKTHFLSLVLTVMLAVAPCFADRIYLIGDATPGGWSLDNAALMVPAADGVYEWVGDLNAGALKFVTHHDWLPSYGPATDNTALSVGTVDLVLRSATADPDNKFTVAAGRYALTIDMSGATPQLTVADGTGIEDKGLNAYYPEVIYAIGSATPAGWTVNNAIEMRESAFNSGIFKQVLTLNTGELKFLHQKDWGAGYGATLANDPVNGSGVYTIAALDDSDKKFAVTLTDATDYKVTVNAVTSSMTLSYYPERLYIIGPAVGGWSWDNNAIEMTTSEEGIFTWAGTLSAGEMKFFTERDFGATAYGATVAGQEIAASGVYDLEKLGAEDKKFIAPVADVILTVDLKQMKLRSVPDTVTGISMVADDGIIRIYDMMGMLRITLPANENITDNLTKGIYIMVKGTETEKIIIR